jgi:hypothetical protein
MKRGSGGIALATMIALAAVASGAGAYVPPGPSRVELGPTPTPTPAVGSLIRGNAPNQAQRTAAIKQVLAQRMTALSHLQPRAFKAPRAVANGSAHQEIQIAGRAGAALARVPDYCANHQPEIDRVIGDVTPGGALTIGGSCFGTSGNVRITGNFPFDPSAINLTIDSWTDTTVKAHLIGNQYGGGFDTKRDSFTGSLDQPVELRLATRRLAGGMVVVGPNLISPPVRLNYRARRVPMRIGADVAACATGEPLEPSSPDVCGQSGWLSSSLGTWHVRKTAASGEDIYSVHLTHGYALDQVTVQSDAAEVSFDPSLDPLHVTFRIRWRTAHKSNPDMVQRGLPQYADYGDGSYVFSVTGTAPDGVLP